MEVICQFVSSEDGKSLGPQISLPLRGTGPKQLERLVNALQDRRRAEEIVPYAFYVNGTEVTGQLSQMEMFHGNDVSGAIEKTVEIVYAPLDVFKCRPVTRSTATLNGHTDSVVSVQFSPDGRHLASASGDHSVRFWDYHTATPSATASFHSDWVLSVAWTPDGKYVASASRDGELRFFDHLGNPALCQAIRGAHSDYITAIAWQPFAALDPAHDLLSDGKELQRRLVSASKDGCVRVWDASSGRCLFALPGHTQPVQCLRWSGDNQIYTASRDRTVNVYNAATGVLKQCMRGHAHWVNCMSLSSDFVTRTGPYDVKMEPCTSAKESIERSKKRYEKFLSQKGPKGVSEERLVTGSDDGSLILWHPGSSAKPIARMLGHQQQVMCVQFSPDGRYIASGSFDKSIRLWDGYSGKFLGAMRGHVGAVYQISWSPDSRMFVSGSKDSTMKLWDARTHKLVENLPGHADEVFSVDWSPDGELVASGSFDRTLKLWHH